jgi:hypothetical protein
LGFHQPSLGEHSIDWKTVEIRRQEFNLMFDGVPSAALLPGPEEAALIEAFTAYDEGVYARVVDRWPKSYRENSSPIQQMLLARSYAELGRPDCLELIAALEEEFPIEASAVNAVFYSQIGNVAEVTQSLDKYYALLAESPWLVTVVAEAALERTLRLAQADRAAAAKMYKLLAKPLASSRYDYKRKLVRVFVAQQLGPREMAEALTETEPYVRWTADVLQPRAEAYAALNHPFAARAQREWQQFQQNQPQ